MKTFSGMKGVQCDVVSFVPQGSEWTDEFAEAVLQDHFSQRIKMEESTWSRWLAGLVKSWWVVPDSFILSGRKLVKTVLSKGRFPYDAMVTWSQPHSAHVMGFQIKRKIPSLPWIARVGDPWSYKPYGHGYWWINAMNRRFERRALSLADRVVFTNQDMLEISRQRLPDVDGNKMLVIPHAYDDSLYPPLEQPADSTLTIRYLGDFYGIRNPLSLVRAVAALQVQRPELSKGLRIELIGRVPPVWKEMLKKNQQGNEVIHCLRRVNFLAALRLMRQADGLLVVDAPADRSVFFPSKLADYLGARRPVFGIVPPGPSYELIQSLGGWTADPNDPEAIGKKLAEFIQYCRAHRGKAWGHEEVIRRYDSRNIGARYLELIEQVIEGAR